MAKKANMSKVERKRLAPIRVSDAEITFKNFAGQARRFNAAGARNFHLVLDTDTAINLENLGWNISWHEPKREDEVRWASLKVAVRFDKFPPTVTAKTLGTNTRVPLDETTVSVLDWAELDHIRLMITASFWENADGESGYKAYLSRMLAVIDPDDLDMEGIDVPENNRMAVVEDDDD